ncbi:MAG: HEAT repeat domain-containing protein [Porticoccaceae bacterium]|nr:HEAT repeat domain-containing protein [Porticoccaceae bacterium]
MSNNDLGTEYSSTLKNAIELHKLNCCVDTPTLSKQDIVDLQAILGGTKTTTIPIDTKRAIALLSHAGQSAESNEILGSILANTREKTNLRVSAAAGLGVSNTKAAENILLDNIDTTDSFVREEIIKSLGKVGSSKAVDILTSRLKTTEDQEHKLVSFALTAIAFREGDASSASIPDFEWHTQTLKSLKGKALAENINNIWGSSYGLTLNKDIGFSATCGHSTLGILLNKQLSRGSWLDTLLSQALLLGLITAKESQMGFYSVRYILMSRPTKTGFALTATKTSGDVALAGNAVRDGDKFNLTLLDVGLERIPTQVKGTISNELIEANIITWPGTIRNAKHGNPIV